MEGEVTHAHRHTLRGRLHGYQGPREGGRSVSKPQGGSRMWLPTSHRRGTCLVGWWGDEESRCSHPGRSAPGGGATATRLPRTACHRQGAVVVSSLKEELKKRNI